MELENLRPSSSILQGPVLQSTQLYQHLSLSHGSRTIRLLDLSGEAPLEGPLEGTLRLASLDSSPKYAALLYVWGNDSTPNYFIICNNARLKLTTNLYDALTSLLRMHGPLTIWVDAVSIN